MTTNLREDLLLLLEAGPQPFAQLQAWLACTDAALAAALRAMAGERLVRRVGPGLWALAAHQPSVPVAPATEPTTVASAAESEDTPALFEDNDARDPDLAALEDWDEAPPVRRAGRPKALRQVTPTTVVQPGDAPAWWVGKSRTELNAIAHERAHTMSNSRIGRTVLGVRVRQTSRDRAIQL